MKKSKLKFYIILGIVVIMFFSFFTYYKRVSKPYLENLASEIAKTELINAVNKANIRVNIGSVSYKELFDVKLDDNKNIVGIISNTALINQINTLAQFETQNQLNLINDKKVPINIGSLTGNGLIASLINTKIFLTIESVSNCQTEITSHLDSTGINQTLHSLVITTYATINVLTPTNSYSSTVTNDYVVAQNIIVGDVPSTFIGSGDPSDYLDLIP